MGTAANKDIIAGVAGGVGVAAVIIVAVVVFFHRKAVQSRDNSRTSSIVLSDLPEIRVGETAEGVETVPEREDPILGREVAEEEAAHE